MQRKCDEYGARVRFANRIFVQRFYSIARLAMLGTCFNALGAGMPSVSSFGGDANVVMPRVGATTPLQPLDEDGATRPSSDMAIRAREGLLASLPRLEGGMRAIGIAPQASNVTEGVSLIDYRKLHAQLAKWRAHPEKSFEEDFPTVLQVMRTATPEQCAELLDIVAKWTMQPAKVMSSNVKRALSECPSLTDNVRRQLVNAIIEWDLSVIPQDDKLHCFRRIAQEALMNHRADERDRLVGRLMTMAAKCGNREDQVPALEGIVRVCFPELLVEQQPMIPAA
ncbi:hypothetical protein LJR230_001771 [Trinickia sp. LjRoot230]|uniref:hypothetical protein n=1 Tax=Trinickia sp. LjRoot230 TaxID=3342288 RepID=UPI003ED12752